MGNKEIYEEYLEVSINRKIVLFGASKMAIQARERYLINEEIYRLSDNDDKKWGTIFDGSLVVPPQTLLDDKDNIVIIITSMYYKEISAQLKDMGFPYVFSHKILRFKESHSLYLQFDAYKIMASDLYRDMYKEGLKYKETIPLIDANLDKINQVKTILYDEKSLNIYETYIRNLRYNYADYRDLEEPGNAYFADDIFTYTDDEIFIDAGCYDAATTFEFAKEVKFKFNKVYAFEPDEESYIKAKERLEESESLKNRFEIFKSGLSNESRTVKFDAMGNEGSHISESGNSKIEVVKLDDVVKDRVTFIKMDIEGEELNALKGAEKIIKEYSPKLAICIYHKIEDLWEIPLLIKRINPNYKLYIRHHSIAFNEKILYAVV